MSGCIVGKTNSNASKIQHVNIGHNKTKSVRTQNQRTIVPFARIDFPRRRGRKMIAAEIKLKFSIDIGYVRSHSDNCWIVSTVCVEHVQRSPNRTYNLYCIPIDSHSHLNVSYIIGWIVFRTPRHTLRDGWKWKRASRGPKLINLGARASGPTPNRPSPGQSRCASYAQWRRPHDEEALGLIIFLLSLWQRGRNVIPLKISSIFSESIIRSCWLASVRFVCAHIPAHTTRTAENRRTIQFRLRCTDGIRSCRLWTDCSVCILQLFGSLEMPFYMMNINDAEHTFWYWKP